MKPAIPIPQAISQIGWFWSSEHRFSKKKKKKAQSGVMS